MRYAEDDRKNAFLMLLDGAREQMPSCPHVVEGCGGCLLQTYSYDDQLRAKRAFLLSVYGRDVNIVPAVSPLGYRSRMDYVCAFGRVGLRKRGKFALVVDTKDCMLLPDGPRRIFDQAHDFLIASGVQFYNYVRHEGFLRYITIRQSAATGQVMLVLTTKKPADDVERTRMQELFEGLFLLTKVTSLHWTVNDSKSDVSIGEPFWHIGEQCIVDEIAQSRFFIMPQTFFQGNPAMAGVLFDRAMRFVKGTVLDLYSGVGVLAILAAQEEDADEVIGVELVERSIAAAKENMQLNEITTNKCSFVCDDAAKYYETSTKEFHTVICDPSRPGLGKDLCAALLRKLPARIIYISCNPISHNDDLKLLLKNYDLLELEGYDLFPQTPHIEVLSVLERRNS